MKKMSRIEIDALPEFEKDLKQLLKRYRTLNEDLAVLGKVLNEEPNDCPPFSYRIEGLGIKTCIVKVRKIACKALKGRGAQSGLRLIYAYFKEEGRIIFIELYHKNDQENEDRERILRQFT